MPRQKWFLSIQWITVYLLSTGWTASLQQAGDNLNRPQFLWWAGPWTECVGHCNLGKQSRTVVCIGNNDRRPVVHKSFCDITTQPFDERACILNPCYSWYVGDWDEECHCPGVTVRPVVCYLQDEVDGLYRAVSPSTCLDPKPAMVRSCQPTVSCQESTEEPAVHRKLFEWKAGPWSKCNSQCGPGKQSRPVWCTTATSSGRNDSQTPDVSDVIDDVIAVSDDQCESGSKPKSSRDCNSGPCKHVISDWIMSAWSECSDLLRSCNNYANTASRPNSSAVLVPLIQTRQVACAPISEPLQQPDETDNYLDGLHRGHLTVAQSPQLGSCDRFTRPETTRECHAAEIGSLSADGDDDLASSVTRTCVESRSAWYTSQWSSCSASCGQGRQYRNVFCLLRSNSHSFQLANSDCDQTTRPVEVQDCNAIEACHFIWLATEFSECSEECGGGLRQREVFCYDDDVAVDRSLCDFSAMPSETETCNEQSCEPEGTDEVITCHASPFGCCPDGVTPASGPAFVGCFQADAVPNGSCIDTKFGCCPDGATEATGPNGQGCPDGDCHQTDYGCCPDGTTSARGPEGEGCTVSCAEMLYGCCLDGETPANGPDLAGCDDFNDVTFLPVHSTAEVANTDFAQALLVTQEVADSSSSVISSLPSTVPDVSTEATATTDPDVINVAKSDTAWQTAVIDDDDDDAALNLPMSSTATAAAEAEVEAAVGENEVTEGYDVTTKMIATTAEESPQTTPCSDDSTSCVRREFVHDPDNYDGSGEVECVLTSYGCCPDGRTPRQSFDLTTDGCSTSETTQQQATTVPRDPTANPTFSELFDDQTTTGSDAKSTASTNEELPVTEMTSPDDVIMETDTVFGDSTTAPFASEVDATTSRYGDDTTPYENEIQKITENTTVFSGKYRSTYQGRCFEPVSRGNCSEELTRWYYDVITDKCIQFQYTGCHGNDNRFETQYDCQSACALTGLAVCALPADAGPCNVPVVKWHYSREKGRCVEFMFGGCHGNANKFDTKHECDSVCPVTEICNQEPDSGRCTDVVTQYYFNWPVGECLMFEYTGCQGNANRFTTRAECQSACKGIVRPTEQQRNQAICQLPMEQGPCQLYIKSYYFNPELNRCEVFLWGGCRGNENRFETIEACESRCLNENDDDTTGTTRQSLQWQNNSSCMLPNDAGPCKDYSPMWYFEPTTGVCRRFYYGGCDGNDNRFPTADECWQRCGATGYRNITHSTGATDPVDSLATTTDVMSRGNNVDSDVSSWCLLPVDVGPCMAHQMRWYYDATTGTCRQFHYGGCQGNANNFNTSAECFVACHDLIREATSSKPSDVCSLSKEQGECFDEEIRYYWDRTIGECRPFSYTGCHGNGNNFLSQDECYATCSSTMMMSSSDQSQQRLSSATALATRRYYWPGDCYEPVAGGTSCREDVDGLHLSAASRRGDADPRWYYDSGHGTCLAFYFAGCNGNGNNFYAYDDCMALCSTATEICGLFQCDLVCDFGFMRGPDGCLLCQCRDPCQNHHCKDGMECYIDVSSCETAHCPPRPSCRTASKPGKCPAISLDEASVHDSSSEATSSRDQCHNDCASDSDCASSLKCCDVGCNKTCVEPSLDEVPTILDRPRQIFVVVGNNATIQCKAQGAPLPQITWFRNGIPILVHRDETLGYDDDDDDGDNDVDDDVRMSLSERDTILTITNVKRQDAASYSCRAFNTAGAATKTYYLIVQVPAQIVEMVPASLRVTAGDTAKFKCITSGDPAPTVSWFIVKPDGDLVPAVSEDDLGNEDARIQTDGGVIEVKNATTDDDGVYLCQADNKIGPSQQLNASLDVLGDFFLDVTVQSNSNKTGDFAPGDNMTLLCYVTGDVTDDIRITWLKDAFPLDGDSRFSGNISAGELIVTDMSSEDSGEYSCSARRDQQEVHSTVTVAVKGRRLPEGCADKPWLANCRLLVEANLCTHPYYRIFCCKSCFDAGKLDM